MLKVTFKQTYIKRGTNTKGFIYSVTGDQAELDAYVAAKVKGGMPESAIKGKDGVVSFEREYIGQEAQLLLNAKGNYYPDTRQHDIAISQQRQIQGGKLSVAAE
jgi:hypothetical protein